MRTPTRTLARALALLLGLALPACAETMPSKRPANAEFRYNFDGGMRPTYRWLEIRGHKGHVRGRHRRQKYDFRFKVAAATADRLWRLFRANRFTDIETRDGGKVYDRGGVTLVLGWDGKNVRVASSGRTFVERRWWPQFRVLRAAMEKILNAELKKRGLAQFK